MLVYPKIDPIVVSIGPLAIHWYGVMYLLGFVLAWWLLSHRAKANGLMSAEQVSDLVFYAALGVVIGGRLGYMVFYDLPVLIQSPLQILKVWQGGMSFHGGMIGVILAMWWYAHRLGLSIFDVTDFIAPVVPLGLGAGRMGNFINGELWGQVTDVPWGMVFPMAGDLPRHPSQLYEFLLEGVLLFLLLWTYSATERPKMTTSGLFLMAYGCFRMICELFRQPDVQYGFFAGGWLTMGQILSLPMVLLGVTLFVWGMKKERI